MGVLKFLPAFAVAAVIATPATAQQARAGDKDDQIVITGCVVRTNHKMSGPRSLLVWSKGDVYLDAAGTDIRPPERAIGTSGKPGPMFYWIDDEDDFAKHVGKRVEIVGELNDEIDKGEIEVDHKDDFTEIEFEWDGTDVKARVPSAWLGPDTPAKDSDFDIAIRRVDVEKVTVVSPSCN